MTQLTEKDVTKIAKLARIAVTPEEVTAYTSELSKMLAFFDALQEVNTDNVPLMTSVAAMQLPMRKDVVSDGDRQAEVLQNAPGGAQLGCFVVPKVIE